MKVTIESEYCGDPVALNRVREVARAFALAGHRVYASHLWYTQFLNESEPQERKLGIALGRQDMLDSDMVVLLTPCAPTSAAWDSVEEAAALGKRVLEIKATDNVEEIVHHV